MQDRCIRFCLRRVGELRRDHETDEKPAPCARGGTLLFFPSDFLQEVEDSINVSSLKRMATVFGVSSYGILLRKPSSLISRLSAVEKDEAQHNLDLRMWLCTIYKQRVVGIRLPEREAVLVCANLLLG